MSETGMARSQKNVHLSGTSEIGLTRDSVFSHMQVSTQGMNTVQPSAQLGNGCAPTYISMRNGSDGTRDFPCSEENSTTPSWPKHLGMNATIGYMTVFPARLLAPLCGAIGSAGEIVMNQQPPLTIVNYREKHA